MEFDMRGMLVQNFVKKLEVGVAPWVMPWAKRGLTRPASAVSNKPYTGMNVLLLLAAQLDSGYSSSRWLTNNQAKEAGGKLKKGEYPNYTPITFYTSYEAKDKDTGKPKFDDNGEPEMVMCLRYFKVYNVDQFDDLPEKIKRDGLSNLDGSVIHEDKAEAFFDESIGRLGLNVVREGGDKAYYHPTFDSIQLPDRRLIVVRMQERIARGMATDEALGTSISEHYGILAHELGHATGHTSRLKRTFGSVFGSPEYAFEELVAELCSAFVMSELSLPGYCQHVEYLGSWAKRISSDPKILFSASTAAGKAADLILGRSKAPYVKEPVATSQTGHSRRSHKRA